MHKLLFLFFQFLLSMAAYSQSIKISGAIKDTSNNPIEGAIVSIQLDTTFNNVIAYAISDEFGIYSAFFEKNNYEQVMVKISYIGYVAVTKNIKILPNNRLDITLIPDSKELEEVIVQSKITSDTVGIRTYNLNLTDNSTLRDILDRTEGFLVSKEGGISYNGLPINKILINKKEVFINQNKIALDNLNYEIMDSIQVIKNYRDRFRIDFDNLTTPVLNINTKSNFKGVLKATISGGVGYKDKYQTKLKAMYFSDKLNMFSTGNGNNTGEKDFSNDDVIAPLINKSTGYYKSLLQPFFSNDDLLKKDINANASITTRQQNAKNKMGLLVQYNYMNREKHVFSNSSIPGLAARAKTEQNVLTNMGSFLTIDYNYSQLLSSKTSLNYTFNTGIINDKAQDLQNIEIYFPDTAILSGTNNKKPNGSIIANEISLQSLVSRKLLFETGIYYTIQKASYNVNTIFTDQKINVYNHQEVLFYRNGFDFFLSGKYRRSNLVMFEFRPRINYLQERNKMNAKYDIRKAVEITPSFFVQGQNKKISYVLEVAPDLYIFTNTDNNKVLPKINALFDYRLSSRSSASLKIQQTNKLIDFNNLIDTLNTGYNSRLVTDSVLKYTLSPNSSVGLGYYYSDIIHSLSFYTELDFISTRHSVQNFFQTVDKRNIYYYRNQIIDKTQSGTAKIGIAKSVYITPKQHKFNFKINGSYQKESTYFNEYDSNILMKYQNNGYGYNFEIFYQHNGDMTHELRLLYTSSIQKAKINSQQYFYRTNKLGGELFSHNDRLEIKTGFYHILYKNGIANFSTPLLNILGNYRLNDRFSFFAKGEAIFDLFKLRNQNYTSYQLYYEGSLVNEVFTHNRISYLIAGITYKF